MSLSRAAFGYAGRNGVPKAAPGEPADVIVLIHAVSAKTLRRKYTGI